MDPIVNEEENSQEPTSDEIQKDRAFLREKFLRFIANISNGHKCQFVMFENITVQANLRAVDLDFQNIAVENLETPYLPVKHAILRSGDVISMHFTDIPVESLKYC